MKHPLEGTLRNTADTQVISIQMTKGDHQSLKILSALTRIPVKYLAAEAMEVGLQRIRERYQVK